MKYLAMDYKHFSRKGTSMFGSHDVFDWVDTPNPVPCKKPRFQKRLTEFEKFFQKKLGLYKVYYCFLPKEMIKEKIKREWQKLRGDSKKPRYKVTAAVSKPRVVLKDKAERKEAERNKPASKKNYAKKSAAVKKNGLIKSAMKSVKGPSKESLNSKKRDVTFAADLPRARSRSPSPFNGDDSMPSMSWSKSPERPASVLSSRSRSPTKSADSVNRSKRPIFSHIPHEEDNRNEPSPSRSRSVSPVDWRSDSVLLRSRSRSPSPPPMPSDPLSVDTTEPVDENKSMDTQETEIYHESENEEEHENKDEPEGNDEPEDNDEPMNNDETEQSGESRENDDSENRNEPEASHKDNDENIELEKISEKFVKISISPCIRMIPRVVEKPVKISVSAPIRMTLRKPEKSRERHPSQTSSPSKVLTHGRERHPSQTSSQSKVCSKRKPLRPVEDTPLTSQHRTPDVVNKVVPLASRDLFNNNPRYRRTYGGTSSRKRLPTCSKNLSPEY